MKELVMGKGTEKDCPWVMYHRETGQTLYRLYLTQNGLWSRRYGVRNQEGEEIGTLEDRREAFRLVKMPRIRGFLGKEEVFFLKRELEALQDRLELEGKNLQVEGDLLEGNFHLSLGNRLVGTFQNREGERWVRVQDQEPLNVLLAFALECL